MKLDHMLVINNFVYYKNLGVYYFYNQRRITVKTNQLASAAILRTSI